MTLEELKKLSAEATIGPWTWRDGVVNKYIDDDAVIISSDECANMSPANIKLIVAVRNMLPKLIKVAEAAIQFREMQEVYEQDPVCDECRDFKDEAYTELGETLAALETK